MKVVPTYQSFIFLSEHETNSRCFSVSYRTNGGFVVACFNEIFLYDKDINCLGSIRVKGPSSALGGEDGNIYFIQNPDKIQRCDPLAFHGLDHRHHVCRFDESDSEYDHLTVNEHNFAVTKRDVGTILITRIRRRSRRKITPSDPPFYLCFYTDGGLLVTSNDADTLTKYKWSWRERADKVEWVLKGLAGAAGVCIDRHGQVFVGSNKKKVVYVVSPTGKYIIVAKCLFTLEQTKFICISGVKTITVLILYIKRAACSMNFDEKICMRIAGNRGCNCSLRWAGIVFIRQITQGYFCLCSWQHYLIILNLCIFYKLIFLCLLHCC